MQPKKFTQSDIDRAIHVAFGAGFSAGESRKFKTAIEAWEATQKAADRLRLKQLAQKR
jgi:hypothetical protein